MSYSVRLLPVAKADRRRIFYYIEERSLRGAESWELAYEASLVRLEASPYSCGLAPETDHFNFDLRQLLFRTRSGLTYRLLFRVDDDRVTIYRVLGPGQPPLSSEDIFPATST